MIHLEAADAVTDATGYVIGWVTYGNGLFAAWVADNGAPFLVNGACDEHATARQTVKAAYLERSRLADEALNVTATRAVDAWLAAFPTVAADEALAARLVELEALTAAPSGCLCGITLGLDGTPCHVCRAHYAALGCKDCGGPLPVYGGLRCTPCERLRIAYLERCRLRTTDCHGVPLNYYAPRFVGTNHAGTVRRCRVGRVAPSNRAASLLTRRLEAAWSAAYRASRRRGTLATYQPRTRRNHLFRPMPVTRDHTARLYGACGTVHRAIRFGFTVKGARYSSNLYRHFVGVAARKAARLKVTRRNRYNVGTGFVDAARRCASFAVTYWKDAGTLHVDATYVERAVSLIGNVADLYDTGIEQTLSYRADKMRQSAANLEELAQREENTARDYLRRGLRLRGCRTLRRRGNG